MTACFSFFFFSENFTVCNVWPRFYKQLDSSNTRREWKVGRFSLYARLASPRIRVRPNRTLCSSRYAFTSKSTTTTLAISWWENVWYARWICCSADCSAPEIVHVCARINCSRPVASRLNLCSQRWQRWLIWRQNFHLLGRRATCKQKVFIQIIHFCLSVFVEPEVVWFLVFKRKSLVFIVHGRPPRWKVWKLPFLPKIPNSLFSCISP